jgi:hypothetical protein
VRGDFHVDEPTVFQTMPPLAGELEQGAFCSDICQQPGDFFGRSNIAEPHPQEFFPGVPIPRYGRLIDLQEVKGLGVVDPQRVGITGEQHAEAGFAFAQSLLGLSALLTQVFRLQRTGDRLPQAC